MSIKLKALSFGSVLLLAGCTHAGPREPLKSVASQQLRPGLNVTAISRSPRYEIVPLVDAHQHMMSSAAMALAAPQPSPSPVTVPRVLVDLLSAREKLSDQASYAALFAPDAILYAEEHGRWWKGEERILDAIDNFPSGLRFVPTSYALDGSAGYISGMLRTASGEDTHNFTLGIRKGADGRWRIASEMKQPTMPPTYAPSITAEKVIESLDDAGIKYGTVLSLGFWFGRPGRQGDQHANTRAENDWTIAETGKYSDRLIPFCGVNPLADYAIAELERCATIPRVRGMKVHFNNSRVDIANPEHVDKLRQFFRAANEHRLAIVVHFRGDPEIFISRILPEALDVPIQIAHMGSGWKNAEVFADAIQAGRPGTKNLYFDWTQALPIEGLWGYGPSANLSGSVSPEDKAWVVGIMRKISLDRILYGTDMPLSWNPSPRDWWRKTILTLPLTDQEIATIADNVPPYIR